MTRNDPQEVISRFAEAVFEAVGGKDKYYGSQPLTSDEWAKLEAAFQRMKGDADDTHK